MANNTTSGIYRAAIWWGIDENSKNVIYRDHVNTAKELYELFTS